MENESGLDHLSFSRISKYRSCSLCFKFSYVDKIPPAFTPGCLAFGIAFHEGAALGLEGLLAGAQHSVDDPVKKFQGSLDEQDGRTPIKWSGDGDKNKADVQARAMFESWMKWERPKAGILGIEQEFKVELAPWLPPIVGRVDAIEEHETAVVVVDLKSSRCKWDGDDVLQHQDQLVIYRHAFRELSETLGKPIVAAFEIVTKTKKPEVQRLYLKKVDFGIERQVKMATVMVEGVERGIFLPNPSWACATCPYQEPCREW